MQSTAQLWLVYKLTNSVALLGVFGFANQIPILVLASVGGYVGDRYNQHHGVIWTQAASMVLAFLLAGLTLTGTIHDARGAWVIIFIAFLADIVNAFDVPIRQAFLVQMVGKEDLPNAIALNSSIFNGARVFGAGIAARAEQRGLVLSAQRLQLPGGDRGAAGHAHPENGNEARRQRLSAAELCARVPFRDERYAGPIRPAAAELVELFRIAIFRVPAGVRERHFARRGARFWTADEHGGGGRGAGRIAFCGANELSGPGAVDCVDLEYVCGVAGSVFAVAGILAFVGGAAGGGIFGYVADGGDQYGCAEPGARRTAREGDGGLRDHVHGGAADRVVGGRRSGETDWCAGHHDGFWVAGVGGEFGVFGAGGDAVAADGGGRGYKYGLRPHCVGLRPGQAGAQLAAPLLTSGVRAVEPIGRDEGRRGGGIVGDGQDGVDFFASWSEGTDGVGGGGIAGEEQGLAAAAAEILGATVAGFAGFLHPVFATKLFKGFGHFPDLAQAAVLHVFKLQSGNDLCGVAGKSFASGCDEHEFAPPAAHAGLGIFGVIVRYDVLDTNFSGEALLRALEEINRSLELLAVGQETVAIGESPAVILHVGEFDASGAGGFGEGEHFGELIEVLTVDYKVEGNGDATGFQPLEDAELLRVGLGAGDRGGGFFAGALKT